MLPELRIVLILLSIFYCCAGDKIYDEAVRNTDKYMIKDKELYKTRNCPPSNYMYSFALEVFGPTPENRDAEILVEYQRLLKRYDQCKNETFQHCLRKSGKDIPKKDKCLIFDGVCDCNEKYSKLDGSCNNLQNPNMGQSRTTYSRILGPVYANGINEIRRTESGHELPNPRMIGNLIAKVPLQNENDTYEIPNVCGLLLTQLAAHDTSSRKVVTMEGNNSYGISCCKADYSGPEPRSKRIRGCIPIEIPKNDPFYGPCKIRCQNYARMEPTLQNNCAMGYEHANYATSFLDLDVIYSTSHSEMQQMRAHCGGRIKMCSDNLLPEKDGQLFAGDFRYNQTPFLAIIHSLFYRLHNNIAKALEKLNSCWDDDKLFFESRRITIAFYQHIIYNEWLPLVLGKERWFSYKLNTASHCDKYNRHVNPTTLIEYAHNSMRWFHMNVPSKMDLVNCDGKLEERIPLSDTYLKLDLFKHKYNECLGGMLKQKQRMYKVGYTNQLRNLAFKRPWHGKEVGVDIFAIDVMRARDCGSAPYIAYFPKCASVEITCWDDLKKYFDPNNLLTLQTLYAKPCDIELYIGMLWEKKNGNEMGTIAGCLIAEQFKNFKSGDRFFYSHCDNPHKFSKDQLDAIKKMTFSTLIRMTTDLKKVPQNGFISISRKNPYIECHKIKPIDFSSFKDRSCHSSSHSKCHCSSPSSSSSSSSSPSSSSSSSSSCGCGS